MNSSSAHSESFLVFSDDWGEHPSSCQHIFKHIVKDHKVLWVNTIGMRGMKFTHNDCHKALLKLKKMFFGAKSKPQNSPAVIPNLTVIQPFMLPFVKMPGVRTFNAASVIRSVKRKMVDIGMQAPILVTTVPNACDYAGKVREKRTVYYCVDDFTFWPGLEHKLVLQMENKLIEKSDVFLATSNNLYERLKKTGKPTTLLTHGVDFEHFNNLPKAEHPLLADIPKPRVGYFGLFDERSDQELLAEVAKALPYVSFVMTGHVVTDISKLEIIPNIYLTGPVSYNELPAIVAGWNVCMLPYKINNLAQSINPLKLKEYLATGKPVISTALPEAAPFSSLLCTCKSISEWIAALENSMLGNELTSDLQWMRMNSLLKETWKRKAEVFLSFSSASMD